MKALVTGAGGQLGGALLRTVPAAWQATGLTHRELDISDAAAVARVVGELAPQLIINAAAYTAVDRAESEPDVALRINATGAENLARAAREAGARFIHVSTDFVFDGLASRPYLPDAPTRPLSAYGRSKLEGEQRVRNILGDEALIVRTAWVYAANGQNFVRTMLRLMGERDRVRVVADQIGSPTWATSLARALWAAAERGEVRGIQHWTDAGVASWYDFAVAIREEALAMGLLSRAAPVEPIATEDYPTPARRPAYSVLDRRAFEQAIDMRPEHWRANLRRALEEMKGA
ncbi:MAG TPA: dTDP-4-dehydrorhamnose reductase [Gammaproteobacteria bacterium]|nr:dTDP-4-dehydrorhamnose reductase [Gammaproteobacteria bacterium]